MPSQHTVLYAEETRRMVQWIPLKVTVANKSAPVEHHTPSHTTYRWQIFADDYYECRDAGGGAKEDMGSVGATKSAEWHPLLRWVHQS